VLSFFAGLALLVSEEEEEDAALSDFSDFSVFLLFDEPEYASAYQPPPLRMKFPPLIWRLAVFLEHLGQISIAGSEIFWISSHAFAQSVHTYS